MGNGTLDKGLWGAWRSHGRLQSLATILFGPPAVAGVSGAESRGRLIDIHRLRGVTMLQIVFLHTFAGGLHILGDANARAFASMGEATAYRWVSGLVEVAFHDVTIYLVLIAGILYSRVFAPRPLGDYFRSRTTNVVLPYLLFTFLLSTCSWSPGEPPRWQVEPSPRFVERLWDSAWSGTAEFHLWFIPVAVCLFAFSPLLHRFVVQPGLAPLAVLVAAAPLVVSRTWMDVTWAQVVYFAGPYLIGMAIGCDMAATRAFIAKHMGAIALAAVGLSAALLALQIHGIDRIGITSPKETLFYLQKVALFSIQLHLCGSLLDRAGPRTKAIVDRLADRAFPLYLVHVTVLTRLLQIGALLLGTPVSLASSLGAILVVFVAATGISVLLIEWAKRLAGRWSRFVIGV